MVKNWRSLYRLYHAPDCPYWTIGDWCPFCATFHHSYPGCWCYSGGCPKDNSAYNADGVLGFRNNRWRGFDGDLTLLDYRFVLPAPCCVCEEHLSSWYSGTPEWRLEEASGNIDAVYIDGNGDIQPLPLGTMTEALHIKGKSPSSAPNDSRVIVKATVQPVGGNEISATFTTLVTVASTRVVKNVNDDVGQSIEARLALTNGTYAVKTDREKLVPFYLLSDALLDGNFHLTLGGEPGAFKVWSGDSTNSTLLLECNQTITNGNPHFFAAMGVETQVWLEVLKPGPCEISYGFTGEGNAEGISFTDTISITAQWMFKVQVIAEDGYSAGNSTGPAVNLNINWGQFDLTAIMQDVADFYEAQFGIDLIWTNTLFTMPTTNINGVVTNFYWHTGEIRYQQPGVHIITNGSGWVEKDLRLEATDAELYREIFRHGEDRDIEMGRASKFIQYNRNDTTLYEYVKIILPSRIGVRTPNGRYVMEGGIGNAQAYVPPRLASPAIFGGAHVSIVNIAEENFLINNVHYSEADFIDIIKFCIAHELFHLIWGKDSAKAGYISAPPSTPFSEVKAGEEERSEINLPERWSLNR